MANMNRIYFPTQSTIHSQENDFSFRETTAFNVPTNNSNGRVKHVSESVVIDIPGAIYVIFCTILVLFFTLGLVQNSLTIYVFIKERCLRQVHNVFIVSLAIGDVSMCVFGVWMVIVSAIFRSWKFGSKGCIYYGFTTTLLGITQISLLATIAIDRYLVIRQRGILKPIRMRTAIIVVICCYGYGLLWAIFPALGWSSYKLEGIRLRCAVNWISRSPADVSYAITILVFAWFLPLAVIVYCCSAICMFIRRDAKRSIHRHRSDNNKKRLRMREKQMSTTVILMIGAFLLSWTPYSVVTLIALVGKPNSLPLPVTIIPTLFAKSSIIWNPIIYVARHKEYRSACIKHCRLIHCFCNLFLTSKLHNRIQTQILIPSEQVSEDTQRAHAQSIIYNAIDKTISLPTAV